MNDDTLRARLRRETTAEHERLDAEASRLNLAQRGDFATFIAMQEAAFASLLRGRATGHFVTRDMLKMFRDACLSDLAHLGRDPAPAPEVASDSAPEAVDHIILGSRLGTAVLRPIWQVSDDPVVSGANAYFSLPLMQTIWRQHCDALSSRPVCGNLSDKILDDTRQLFTLFSAALSNAGQVFTNG